MKLFELDPSLALRPNFGSGVSNRALALGDRTLSELTSGDIAFCLRQSIALSHVLPLALDIASRQPLVEAEGYPGDLLWSLLHAAHCDSLSRSQCEELLGICITALESNEEINTDVSQSAERFVSNQHRLMS